METKSIDVLVRWGDSLKSKKISFRVGELTFQKLEEIGKNKYGDKNVYFWRRNDEREVNNE